MYWVVVKVDEKSLTREWLLPWLVRASGDSVRASCRTPKLPPPHLRISFTSCPVATRIFSSKIPATVPSTSLPPVHDPASTCCANPLSVLNFLTPFFFMPGTSTVAVMPLQW